MRRQSVLVGREREVERLSRALEGARGGKGSILLLAGEAGVGKTRLTTEVAATSGALVLTGAAKQNARTAYGPVAAALRAHLRSNPDALEGCGPLRPHLALLLPELGAVPATSDRPTLFEAVRCALAHLAHDDHLLLILDDLHWSDEATIELLSALAEPLEDLRTLIVASYRSDGLRRDHPLRRLRHDLRRSGRLDEVKVEPLVPAGTTALLEDLLGDAAAASLANAVHDRTQGVPFFVEELAAALVSGGGLGRGSRGYELAAHGTVPLPETVKEAVLIGLSELSDPARSALEAAAVAGDDFDLDVLARVIGADGIAVLLDCPLVVECPENRARFRHALARDAVYADIGWLRRRTLHRDIALAMEAGSAPAVQVAAQWMAARDSARSRAALLEAVAESEAVHAYRDAAEAGRAALELWSDGDDDEAARLEVLEGYARCSELAGDVPEAIRAWRELAAVRRAKGETSSLADAQRRLAAAFDAKGEPEPAFEARRLAAEAFSASGRRDDAAVEHLVMANHVRLMGHHLAAVEYAGTAREDAEAAGRIDIALRARGLEGMAAAKGGDNERGLQLVREALSESIDLDLTAVAAELYQRLSLVLYDAADYPRAEEALGTALELCRASGAAGTEVACVSCLAYVLRDRGDWPRATKMCRDLIAADAAVFVAEGLLGSVHAYQGKLSSARRLLLSALAVSSRRGHYNMRIDATTNLAYVAAAEGVHDEAEQHCRALIGQWADSNDHHYALSGLRWAGAYFARRGARADAHTCVESLGAIASTTGNAEALAAVGHVIAETAMLDGDADTAAMQLTRALDLHRTLDMPFVRAQIELRCGVALEAAGDRTAALERLSGAYRTAKKLGARPLAAEAAREVKNLGESVVTRLGRAGEADADEGGLSRREREVVRLVAVGKTNREIAQDLFLSRRTVDMHVRNILRKLDCRSRVEAANRAGELGLVGQA